MNTSAPYKPLTGLTRQVFEELVKTGKVNRIDLAVHEWKHASANRALTFFERQRARLIVLAFGTGYIDYEGGPLVEYD